MSVFTCKEILKKRHHEKQNVCGTRVKYRDGRKPTAVKVYTVNQESKFLLIQGVPSVGASSELQSLCEQYGVVNMTPLDDYPSEEFCEVYLATYSWFPAARTAKKHLDGKSFFGGILHVCYAPEFESVDETRQKLQARRKSVSQKTMLGDGKISTQGSQCHTLPKQRSLQFSANVSEIPAVATEINSHQPVTYIWAGKEYTVYQNSVADGCPSSNIPAGTHLSSEGSHVVQTSTSCVSTSSKHYKSSQPYVASKRRKRIL